MDHLWILVVVVSFVQQGITQFASPYVVTSTTGGEFSNNISLSQMELVSNVSTVYIPGSELGSNETSITDRFVCPRVTAEFSVDDPTGAPLEITLTLKRTSHPDFSGKVDVKVHWGDGNEDDVKLDSGQKTQKHEYDAAAVYNVNLKYKDDDDDDRWCPVQSATCTTVTDVLDDIYRTFEAPMKYFVSEPILLDSYMEIARAECVPEMFWTVTGIDIDVITPFTDFLQPNTSVLRIEANSIPAGDYVVTLEVQFPNISSIEWFTDSMVISVILPELMTQIHGGEFKQVPHGGVIYIDATMSMDPAENLTTENIYPLVPSWGFAHYPAIPTQAYIDTYLRDFQVQPVPLGTYNTHVVTAGTQYALYINTNLFPANSFAIVLFSLSRNQRQSTAMQAIQFIENAVPVSIDCVYNCQFGHRRFNKDRVELDANLADYIDVDTLTFTWSVIYYPPLFPLPLLPTDTFTGFNTRSLSIKGSSLVEGLDYVVSLTVSGGGYTSTTGRIYKTVNYLPYGGSCVLNSYAVMSARDWVTITCTGWYGNDARRLTSTLLDTNAILSYKVRQRTAGALVEAEPILKTRSQRSHMILKVGTPTGFGTTLTVQITDIFKNFYVVDLAVTSSPSFNYLAIQPSEAGASLVRAYTEDDYPFDDKQLRDMGKSDLLISLVSAVCSNLHLVDLPEWAPPVPRVLNSGGAVLDLAPGGNTDVGSLEEVVAEAENETIDPATLAIQEVMQSMTSGIKFVVETDLNGKRRGDKYLTSLITNAFTNLAARSQFVNQETKVDLIFLADIVGVEALDIPENTPEDLSAQIEVSSGEVFYMTRAVTNAVVPDNLNQIRTVPNLDAGREQIDAMLSVIGGNMSLDASVMSADERAYLYTRMQKVLMLKNEGKKAAAKEAAKMAENLAKKVQDQLKVCKTCDNEGSDLTKQLVKKNDANVLERSASSTETSLFRLDGLLNVLGNSSAPGAESVSVSAFEFLENVYMYDDDESSSSVTSNVLRIDTKTLTNGTRVTPGFITFDQTVVTPESLHVHTADVVDPEDASEFSYHKFIYGKNTDNVCLIVKPIAPYTFTEYEVYFKYTAPPTLIEYDFKVTITQYDDWRYCVLPDKMNGYSGGTFLAVHVKDEMKEVNYTLTIVTVACLTWNEAEAKWYSDKCEMEWLPQYNKISCFCQEVTDLVFANSFFVAPNTIDFSTVFLKFSPLEQAAVMGAIAAIFLIYVIAVILLIGLDRQDQLKWGITPLRDNFVTDRHYYLIKVYTGLRRGAGTTSRIAFILTGSKGGTGPREMFDGVREEFSTGSVMTFFMATAKPLGHLEHLYIWHDNCGEDDYASWYLNQVMVYDIEEKKVYTFVAERWLSVETSVDANLVAIDPEKPVKFESRFFFQTRDRLSESHMWVSILYRPAQSTFTRVQRASCALVYIFLTMIANAMYFNPDDDYQSPPLIQVGPFRFTPQQIFISIVCAIITTPPVMLLIFLFKRTKRKSTSSCGCACCACACTCCPGRRSKKKKERESYEQELRAKQISTDVPDFSGGFYLPHWCIIFAWLLVFVGTVVPAFFILLYSMQWGKQKSEEWLTTFLMSIFESMLCVDPVMVISIALILACCIRSSKSDINVDIAVLIENYERTYVGYHQDNISSSILLLKRLKTDYLSYQNMPRHTFPPLKGQRLNEVAGDHQHQLQLTSMFRDIILNLFFMFIIFSICYGSRDDRSYMHHRETMNTVVEPTKLPHFHSIKTPGDMFTWLNVTAIPHLFPYYDINGNVLHWYYRGFTTGLDYFRLGPPRLRQLRAKPDRCSLPYFGTVDCYGEYTLLGDEDMDYCLGWADKPCPPTEEVYNVSGRAWEYTSAIDIWGLPIPALYTTYGGGGYIAQLDVARSHSVELLTELFDLLWLDRQTRAVMFEYTLYCPATNIFVYHLFVVEYPQTGGAVTFLSIYPIRVYNHVGPMGTFTLVCEVIFVIYLIILLVKLCVRLYQQGKGFFGVFWQVYEMVMFCVGIAACVIYAIKFGMTYLTIEKYKDDIEQFVNFAHLVFWDQMLVMLLAILVFMATLRILEAFASSKKVSAIAKVFKQCGKDLFWYGMAFLHMLFGFCMFGYLLFGKQLVSYMNLFECLGTLFIAMIGKSKYTDLNETQPILAEIFFILYIMVVVFFTLTLFLSILGASIDAVVQGDRQEQKEDLVEHMIKRFKLMFGKHGSGGEKKRVAERKASYRKYIYPTPFQVISLEKIQEKASESRQERSESAINNTRLPSSRHRSNVVVPLNSE